MWTKRKISKNAPNVLRKSPETKLFFIVLRLLHFNWIVCQILFDNFAQSSKKYEKIPSAW